MSSVSASAPECGSEAWNRNADKLLKKGKLYQKRKDDEMKKTLLDLYTGKIDEHGNRNPDYKEQGDDDGFYFGSSSDDEDSEPFAQSGWKKLKVTTKMLVSRIQMRVVPSSTSTNTNTSDSDGTITPAYKPVPVYNRPPATSISKKSSTTKGSGLSLPRPQASPRAPAVSSSTKGKRSSSQGPAIPPKATVTKSVRFNIADSPASKQSSLPPPPLPSQPAAVAVSSLQQQNPYVNKVYKELLQLCEDRKLWRKGNCHELRARLVADDIAIRDGLPRELAKKHRPRQTVAARAARVKREKQEVGEEKKLVVGGSGGGKRKASEEVEEVKREVKRVKEGGEGARGEKGVVGMRRSARAFSGKPAGRK